MGTLSTGGTFKIDGIEFKAKSIKVGYESLAGEDSGRTADGVMRINWVLNVIHKVEITLPPSTGEEVSELLKLVQGREYTLTVYSPYADGIVDIQCYTSNSSTDCYSGILYGGLWQGASFNAIELGGETI